MALISSSLPPPPFASSPSSSTSSSKKGYYDIKLKEARSLSTSLLPRPSTSATPRSKPSSTSMYTHQQSYRRRPSHIPQLKPSTSSNSNSLSTITTATSSSQTSRSTSNSLLTLPHPAAMPGTQSSPLKMVGHQQTNARVLVQCLGSQLLIEDSGAVVTLHQQQRGVKAKRKRFVFDHAAGPKESVQTMMPSLQPLLRQALYGYHGTILCYGPAGCGKSSVSPTCGSWVYVVAQTEFNVIGSPNSGGIIQQTMEALFDMIYKESGNEYILRASYYEVYQDGLYDLICPSNTKITIHQTKKKSAYVGPLTEEIITSPTDAVKIMQKGQANLYLCPDQHAYKDSHVIFKLIIESQKHSNHTKKSHVPGSFVSSPVTASQVMFVDLAESETPPSSSTSSFNVNQHYPLNGRHKRKDIGLTAFEATVLQLSGKDYHYTPFEWKTSTLTRLLEPSLTGQTNLISICIIDDHHHSYDYLKFACRLRKLSVSPNINEETEDQSVLVRHRQDRLKLKKKLAQLNNVPEQTMDYRQILRTALTRQLACNQAQIIAHEKHTSSAAALYPSSRDLSPSSSTSSSSSSSSLSSLLAAATFAKAISDKMEQQETQNAEGSLVKELKEEKQRLVEQNQSLSQQLAIVDQQVYVLEQRKCILDSIPFLKDELQVAKTELEVTKLLVHKL